MTTTKRASEVVADKNAPGAKSPKKEKSVTAHSIIEDRIKAGKLRTRP